MKKKLYIVLIALAVLIGVDIALILYTPTPTGPPPTEPVHPLDEVDDLRIGDVVVTDKNGEWELSSVQYPGGILRGENYTGGDYDPDVTITSNNISFNIGILVSHLNESGKKERELKIIEWTYSNHDQASVKKKQKRIPINFDTLGLKTFRYSTDIPESDNRTITKNIELRVPVLAEKPNGELIYSYDCTFVLRINVQKSDCETSRI
ncbi:MAG: hypothetical protein R6U44_10145 [Archaeoglobaceae archaeon]